MIATGTAAASGSDDGTVADAGHISRGLGESGADDRSAVDLVIGAGEPQRIGRFSFFLDGQRWEWSEAVARMHGYEPGTVEPTTDLLLRHKHPDDRERVAAVLDHVLQGEPFSSRHRIIDTAGHIHWVIVVGDQLLTDAGALAGTTGFYIDITEAVQSDVSAMVADVATARAQIEQAKGVLIGAYGISAERAFDVLVWRSQETNIKLRELAARFVSAVSGMTPTDRPSHIDHVLLAIA